MPVRAAEDWHQFLDMLGAVSALRQAKQEFFFVSRCMVMEYQPISTHSSLAVSRQIGAKEGGQKGKNNGSGNIFSRKMMNSGVLMRDTEPVSGTDGNVPPSGTLHCEALCFLLMKRLAAQLPEVSVGRTILHVMRLARPAHGNYE